MRVLTKTGMLIVVPDDPGDAERLAHFADAYHGHLLRLLRAGRGMQLVDCGREDHVRNSPINITSDSPPPLSLISNFAQTPFDLDGRRYASVEGFWQGLKFPAPEDRSRIAALWGSEAKQAGTEAAGLDTIEYGGRAIRVGTFEHWRLMRRACLAKFSENKAARAALLSTGERPLVHNVRRDSRVIPGVIMADIWMRIRRRLASATNEPAGDDA